MSNLWPLFWENRRMARSGEYYFPFAVIGFIQTLLVTAVTVWGFEVRLAGSLPLLVGLTMLFVLGNLGLGLLARLMPQVQIAAESMRADSPGTADAIVTRWLGDAGRYGKV